MNLPIFDITNIPKKKFYLRHTDYFMTNDEHKIRESIAQQLKHLFKLNNADYMKQTEKIYFVNTKLDYYTLDEIYGQYYKGYYKPFNYDGLAYVVMQKDTPMQIFIPEKNNQTYLNEYEHLILTHKNITNFYNKITKFSLYWNDSSLFHEYILDTLNDYNLFSHIYWILKIINILPEELNIEIMKFGYNIMDRNRVGNYWDLEMDYVD